MAEGRQVFIKCVLRVVGLDLGISPRDMLAGPQLLLEEVGLVDGGVCRISSVMSRIVVMY